MQYLWKHIIRQITRQNNDRILQEPMKNPLSAELEQARQPYQFLSALTQSDAYS